MSSLVHKILPILVALITVNTARAETRLDDLLTRIQEYKAAMQTLHASKPDPEALKTLMQKFQLSPQDQQDWQAMVQAANGLSASDWTALLETAEKRGTKIAKIALNPAREEGYFAVAPELAPSSAAANDALISANIGDFVRAPKGVFYSKTLKNPTAADSTPILIGGGFPFNQTQFADFNQRVSGLSSVVEAYDPICNGMSVRYDALVDGGRTCKLPDVHDGKAMLQQELAVRAAYVELYAYLEVSGRTVTEAEQAIFRATRLSFGGVTLYDQARGLRALIDARGYDRSTNVDRRPIMAGISYGGLLVAKAAAMFPGAFKAVVLFSPGTTNAAHEGPNGDLSTVLESTWGYRRILHDLVDQIALSPRYDVYVPTVLKDLNSAFRSSLEAKMLGELDLDINADIGRIKDRLFIITGGKDDVIPPKTQIAAARVAFSKGIPTSFVLVPTAGHAQWGNPDQQNETAVIHVLTEIQKGDAGLLAVGHAYRYDDASASFVDLGAGLPALAAAEALIPTAKP